MNNEQNHEYLLKVLELSRQKLLDLTRRNRLLNYRETVRDIAIIDEMADLVFEDLVFNAKSFYLDDYKEDDTPEDGLFGETEPDRTLPQTETTSQVASRYRDNLLQTSFSEKELERRLRKLYQEHKTMIEETGANSLFMAMGFLEWSDNEHDRKTVQAPLLLVPVRLLREGSAGQARYSLSFDDGALDTNYSLVEKLKKDFDINFPPLEEEEKPESYWRRVDISIERKKADGWKVAREMVLGLFRFNRQVMWHDLKPSRWPSHAPLVNKKVLKRILLGPKEGDQPPGQIFEDYPQDDEETSNTPSDISLIRDADSFQYSALIDSFACDSGLVIEGPPGTGKSQTITNLIASALGQGLSVLFVAEKIAALDVVYKRLTESGLDPFCLQLHGLKTNKKELLKSIADRINHRADPISQLLNEERQLKQARAELIAHSKALSEQVGPEELPLYDVTWRVERLRTELPDVIDDLVLDIKTDIDFEGFSSIRNQLDDYGKEWSVIPQEVRTAWEGFSPINFNPRHTNTLVSSNEDVINSAENLEQYFGEAQTSAPPTDLLETVRVLKLAKINPATSFLDIPSGADPEIIQRIISNDALVDYKNFLKQIKHYLDQTDEINSTFDYASENAERYAKLLQTHSKRLAGNALNPDISLNQLTSQEEEFTNTLDHLSQLSDDSKYILEILDSVARTLADYNNLSNEIEKLIQGPAELSLHANPSHAKTSIKSYLKQAKDKSKELEEATNELSSFLLHKISTSSEIADSLAVMNEHVNNFFSFFNKNYRETRRFVKSILKDTKLFKCSEDFINELSLLYNHLKQCEDYTANKDFNAELGSFFEGINTNWKKLEELITFSQHLRDKVGPDFTTTILNDWNLHLDLFTDTQKKIKHYLKTISTFSKSHPFPKNLWLKSITEIHSTLSPWVEKIQLADKNLNHSWCQSATSLKDAKHIAKLYLKTKLQEAAIENHLSFRKLLNGKWQQSGTNYINLSECYKWVQNMQALPGMSMPILNWLYENASLSAEKFTCLLLYLHPFEKAWSKSLTTLNGQGKLDEGIWIGSATNTIGNVKNKLKTANSTVNSLPLIERWGVATKSLKRKGFSGITNLVTQGVLKNKQCSKAYEFVLYNSLLTSKIKANKLLAEFSHTRYQNTRERFAELDKSIADINAKKITAELSNASVPDGNGSGPVASYSEKRLLVHEANKKSRHIPIRQLVKRSGKALKSLKPCFLMSPLSVAQYLSPGDIHFDLVVMDEASQLRPEDALGAIARADKSIIVGDPKQLPPTSFFDADTSSDDEAEDPTILDDTESILDVCLKQFPYRRLRWHYRSEHESLIQFSNEKFYDGDLIIFPSPKPESRDYGVHINYIDKPSYKHGRNRREAEIIVENIIHHFRRHGKKSLGVAAFNKAQAEEISLLLEKARQKDPAVDSLIADHQNDEPLFIKNLENVQGDERDVIFISITYGPEEPGGPVAQRFGPINSDLGWRRLNVIATRAKQRVEIFTSMQPSDVRISDNARRGVLSLRDYLDFAISGRIPERGTITGKKPDSEFEIAVMQHLKNLGYECEPQVGVAGFYIDIGVKNPDRPGEYLLGIECDGATYHSSHSVRDRDRLRQEILERKGWYIHRIWSTNWFHTRAAEIDRLKSILEAKLEEDRRTYATISDSEETSEITVEAPTATEEEIESEEQEERMSLEESLERYWEQNIKPFHKDRNRSILSKKMIKKLSIECPTNSDKWFQSIPQEYRQDINPDEGEYMEDIFEIIAEYR